MTSKPCRGYQPLLAVAFAHDVVVAVLARTRQHARRHVAACIDLILAQGTEAGGHTGEVTTMVLVPVVANLDGPPARAGPGLLTSLQLCVMVGYGVCRNPRSVGGSLRGGLSTCRLRAGSDSAPAS